MFNPPIVCELFGAFDGCCPGLRFLERAKEHFGFALFCCSIVERGGSSRVGRSLSRDSYGSPSKTMTIFVHYVTVINDMPVVFMCYCCRWDAFAWYYASEVETCRLNMTGVNRFRNLNVPIMLNRINRCAQMNLSFSFFISLLR